MHKVEIKFILEEDWLEKEYDRCCDYASYKEAFNMQFTTSLYLKEVSKGQVYKGNIAILIIDSFSETWGDYCLPEELVEGVSDLTEVILNIYKELQ